MNRRQVDDVTARQSWRWHVKHDFTSSSADADDACTEVLDVSGSAANVARRSPSDNQLCRRELWTASIYGRCQTPGHFAPSRVSFSRGQHLYMINYNIAAPLTVSYTAAVPAHLISYSSAILVLERRLSLFPYHLTASDRMTLVGRLAANQIDTGRVFDCKETPTTLTMRQSETKSSCLSVCLSLQPSTTTRSCLSSLSYSDVH